MGTMTTETIEEWLIEGLEHMSASKPAASRILSVVNDPDAGAKDLGAALMLDQTLSARAMKLANSAYYGFGGRVQTVDRAVTIVGFDAVGSIAAFALSANDEFPEMNERFWRKSMTVAVAARQISHAFGVDARIGFSAGLLSALGQSVLLTMDSERYLDVIAQDMAHQDLVEREFDSYGRTHTNISALALETWAFPIRLSRAIGQIDSASVTNDELTGLLRVSVNLSDRILHPDTDLPSLESVSSGVLTENDAPALLRAITADLTQTNL